MNDAEVKAALEQMRDVDTAVLIFSHAQNLRRNLNEKDINYDVWVEYCCDAPSCNAKATVSSTMETISAKVNGDILAAGWTRRGSLCFCPSHANAKPATIRPDFCQGIERPHVWLHGGPKRGTCFRCGEKKP